MTDELVIEARKGGPCAELGDRCRAIEAASGCFCAAVADRIEALTAEVRRWQALFDEKHNLMLEHKVRAEKAEAERDRLREALVFYADPETYQDIFVAEDCECCHRRENPAIEDDNGEVARAALNGESHE